MQRLAMFLIVSSILYSAHSLDMSDFVPSFMLSAHGESEELPPVKPLVNSKRSASGANSWYCSHEQDNVTNVFCNKNASAAATRGISYQDGSTDRTQVVDNAATAAAVKSAANQTAIQDQTSRSAIEKQQSQNNLFVPISPNKDVNMHFNQKQLEINIKY